MPERRRSWRSPPARRRSTSPSSANSEVEFPEWMPAVERMLVILRHELNPSHVYTYHSEGFRPGGGLYVFTPGEGRRAVEGAGRLARRADPRLRPVVRRARGAVQLEGRRPRVQRPVRPQSSARQEPGPHVRIYRMNVDGTGLTALTDGASNNFNACWLPDGGIAFLSDRKPAFAYCFAPPRRSCTAWTATAQNVKRLSANYLNDFTPHVMDDGRIIYSRWEYVDRPAIPIQSLWSINPDGTGLSGVFGNRVLSPATFMEARSIPGSDDLLCVMTSHNGPCRGAIGVIDRELRPQRPGGDPQPHAGGQHRPGRRRQRQPRPRALREPLPDRRRVLPGVEAGHDSRPRLRRHQAGRALAPERRHGLLQPHADLASRRAPGHSSTPVGGRRSTGPGPRSACRTSTRGSSRTSSAARSSRFASSRRSRRAAGHRRRSPTSDRKASPRSASSSRWSPAGRPTRPRRSGATPRSRRTARPISRCPPSCRSTSWRSTPKAGPCSGCGASRT